MLRVSEVEVAQSGALGLPPRPAEQALVVVASVVVEEALQEAPEDTEEVALEMVPQPEDLEVAAEEELAWPLEVLVVILAAAAAH